MNSVGKNNVFVFLFYCTLTWSWWKSTSWFVTKMQKVKINLVANFKISNIYFYLENCHIKLEKGSLAREIEYSDLINKNTNKSINQGNEKKW